MKIAKARIYLIESGGIRPVILELVAEDGTCGLGEAAIAYGTGSTAAAGMVKDTVERFLAGGVSAFRGEAIWNEFYDHSFWAKGGGPVVMAGISAVEQAMLDLRARAIGVPVYELLGGRVNDRLRAYCNGWYFGCTSDAELPAAAEAAAAEGYQALKFYPLVEILPDGRLRHPPRRGAAAPDLVKRAVRRVEVIRSAVGPEIAIMLDLSAGLTPDDTIRFCREIERFDIAFIEEPVLPGDTATLAAVKSAIAQPVGVGERLCSRYAFRDVLEARAADIVQPDPGNTGGVMEARRIAAMAEAYGLKVQPHICASAVSTAIGMHFSAAVPNFYWQEHFPYWGRIPGHIEFVEAPVEETVQGGMIPVSDRPGFGIGLRRDLVRNWLWAEIALV